MKVVIKDKAGDDVLNVAEIHGDTLERVVQVPAHGAKRDFFHWPRR